MMGKGEQNNISVRQFTILVFLYSVGTAILVIPSSLAEEVKQDAWIASIISIGISMLLVKLYSIVAQHHPRMTLVEMIEKRLGKWLGTAISWFFVFFALITSSELLNYMGFFMTTQILPNTPMIATNIIFAFIVVMGVRLGLEVLARSAEILFPYFILLLLILLLCIAPQIDIHKIQPIFESSMKPMIRATLLFSSIYLFPAVVFLMIYPSSTPEVSKATKAFYIGVLLAGIVLTIIIACTILVLGAETTSRQLYPSYALAKRIMVGTFFQHVEVVVAVMWFITIYFKMSMYFYVSCVGLSQTLRLHDYRILVYPLGLLLVIFSIIVHPSSVHYSDYNKTTWIPFVATFGILVPLLLLAVSIRHKRAQSRQESCQQEGSKE
ncbi:MULTISPECIES: GerAB/ArcD/ProY family transporter [Paenibacillus]|uniref:Endospore germination permease n=1 Tax=Paenibacillus alvei TaxID=44250 RepID=A0ABT4E9D1_PAEAL|nr:MULTISPECIES: endospore germination permease [Paenibacillus]MCY9530353.1 endospore germination permease [Paenibacillus alvei]